MRRRRTSSSSSTTSFASPRRARRCRRCSAGCPRRSAISRTSRPRWPASRSGSPPPGMARSPRSRPSSSRPTTTPTRPRRRRSATSTRRSAWSARSPSSGIYPAVDPLTSTSRVLDPLVVGQEHYDVARETQRVLQRYRDLQDIIAILGIDELAEEDKATVARARRLQRFMSQPFFVAEVFTGRSGVYVPIKDTVASFKEILEGKTDTLPGAGVLPRRDDRRRPQERGEAGGASPFSLSGPVPSPPPASIPPPRPWCNLPRALGSAFFGGGRVGSSRGRGGFGGACR